MHSDLIIEILWSPTFPTIGSEANKELRHGEAPNDVTTLQQMLGALLTLAIGESDGWHRLSLQVSFIFP